jgi:hypothetical protein
METIAIKKTSNYISVDKKIKDHSNDPFVQKKVRAAKKLISKYGLPKKLK